jgi:hypothetical protein
MERQQAKECLYTWIEIYMKEIGKMIKLVDMVFTSIIMVHITKAIGLKIINMDRVHKLGLMVAHM